MAVQPSVFNTAQQFADAGPRSGGESARGGIAGLDQFAMLSSQPNQEQQQQQPPSGGVFGLPALPGGIAQQQYPAATAHNFAVSSAVQINGMTMYQAGGHRGDTSALGVVSNGGDAPSMQQAQAQSRQQPQLQQGTF